MSLYYKHMTLSLRSSTFEETTTTLLSGLDARSRDIIMRRHGLSSGSIETLESIGKEYGVTRERVRQIEAQAKKLLSRREDLLRSVEEELRQVFTHFGGVLADDHLIELIRELAGNLKPTIVLFYLELSPHFSYVTNSAMLSPHWHQAAIHNEYREAVVSAAEAILKKAGHPLGENDVAREIRASLNAPERLLPPACLHALLRASLHLKRTVFGEWGHTSWVETQPRGVGDKAYVVLRRHGKPAHFREVTNMINEVHFDHKRAHAQTVHNELIKDERFVLVGRGLYGLTEWGFMPGTVGDVLEAILAQAERPLTREELLKRVLEQRLVKKTTVLLGLQNSDRIQKVKGNLYTLRRA